MVNLSLGPILGEITETEVICMIEAIDHRNQKRKLEIEMVIKNKKDGIEERIKKECKQKEPIYFYVDNLKSGEKYQIKFEENGKEIKDTELYGGGLIEYNCEFRTMRKTIEELKIGTVSCNQIESNQNTNVWKEIEDKWFIGKKDSEEKLDIMIHMGDQVYLDKQYHQGVNALKIIDKSEWYTRANDIILSVRDEYRKTWTSNRNMIRIMSQCSNLMILDDHEVCDSWGRLESHYDTESVEYYVGSIIIGLYLQYQQNLLVSSHKSYKDNNITINISDEVTINNNNKKELQHDEITFKNQDEKSYPYLAHFLKNQHTVSESYFNPIQKDWKPRPWNLKNLSHFHVINNILIFFLEHRTFGRSVHFGEYQTNLLSECLLHYHPTTLILVSPIPPIKVNKLSGKIWNIIFDRDNDSWSEAEILSLYNLLYQWKNISSSNKLSIFSGDLHMGALSSIYYYPSYTTRSIPSFSYINHTSSSIISDHTIPSNTLTLQTFNNIHKSSSDHFPSSLSIKLPPLPSSLSLNNFYLGQLVISSSISTQPVFVQKLQKYSFEKNTSSSYFYTYQIPFRLHRNYYVSFINRDNITNHLIFSQDTPPFFNPNSLKNSLSSVLNWLNLCVQPLPSS